MTDVPGLSASARTWPQAIRATVTIGVNFILAICLDEKVEDLVMVLYVVLSFES